MLHEAQRLIITASWEQPLTDQGLDALRPFERLQVLSLIGPGFTDAAVARLFAQHPPLHKVVLYEAGTGRLTLDALTQCPSLRYLEINMRSLHDDDFRDLPPLPQLATCMITGLGDQGACWLARCPNIGTVSLTFSPLTDAGLVHLAGCPQLDSLNLHQTPITDAGIVELLQTSSIRALSLLDCPHITADGIAHWPELPHLATLSVSPELLTPASVARLGEQPSLSEVMVFGDLPADTHAEFQSQLPIYEELELTDEFIWELHRESALIQ